MINILRIKWKMLLLIGILILSSGLVFAEINVSLTDNCYPSGGTISVPMQMTGLDSEVIYSIYTRISYDPDVVTLSGITAGTDLPAGAQLSSNIQTPGQAVIAIWGSNEIGTEGNIANLGFGIIGALGTGTDLTFDYFYFNEGSPSVTTDNGIIFYGDPDPWIDNPGDLTYNENEDISFDITAHDPLGKTLVLNLTSGLPVGAVWQDNGDGTGTFTWQTDYLDGGTYPLSFSVSNPDPLTDNISFNLIINNVTQAPIVVQPIADFSFDEDTINTSIDLNNVYTDYDFAFGDVLNYTYSGNTNIAISIVNGNVTLTPADDWHGTEIITFSATDNQMNTTDETVSITVLNVNDAPIVASPISPVTIQEDGMDASIDLYSVFSDIDGDALSFSTGGAAFIDVDIVNGIVTLTPDENWFGSANITFTADDLQGRATAQTSVDVTVASVNDVPYAIATIGAIAISVNGNYVTAALNTIFTDIDSPLTYEVRNTNHISYVINGNNTVTLTPQSDWYGTENITFVAIDDYSVEVSEVVQVTVADFSIVEDFNHGGALPASWTTLHNGNTTTPWAPVLDSGSDYSMRVANGTLRSSDEKLMSPVYDFTGYTSLTISFTHNFVRGDNNTAYLQITNNGSTYQTLATFTTSTSGTVSYSFNSASYVKFRWYFYSGVNLGASWNIDDMVISGRVSDTSAPTTITDLAVDSFTNDSISLSWTPTSDQFFDYYQIVYSTDSDINPSIDPVWSVGNDADLSEISTDTTIITGVNFNTHYYLAIRGIDVWNNIGTWSNTAECIVAIPATIDTPYPDQALQTLSNSRTVEIGVTIHDDTLVDASSIQCRIDTNGNGVYDPAEIWMNVTGYSNGTDIQVRKNVSYQTDGDNLYFEFRGRDAVGSPFAYSGSTGANGINDDYFVMIDTQAPTTVSDLYVTAYDGNTITLTWTPVTELHFAGYEIFYSTTEGVTTSDSFWSIFNDPEMLNISTSTTTITGLTPGTMYYFALRALDHAGNASALSNEVTSVPRSDLPTCSLPFPATPVLGNNRTVTVGCTFEDYFGIDESSIQYRIDTNGNGVYDPEETWFNYAGRVNHLRNTLVEVRAEVTYNADGEILPFEFRAWDIDGFGPVYSGTTSTEGISDDWYVSIDSISPDQISTVVAYANGSDAATVYWTSSSDDHFLGYEVYYATHEVITTSDNVWNWNDDPTLTDIGAGFTFTNITGLNSGTTYYFNVRAVDTAGNASALSEMEASVTTEGSFAPANPTGVTIIRSGSDIILSWNPVTTNTNGDPITISGYEVYASNDPDFTPGVDTKITSSDGDNDSSNATYTHSGILGTITKHLFYKVTASNAGRSVVRRSFEEDFLRQIPQSNKDKEVK